MPIVSSLIEHLAFNKERSDYLLLTPYNSPKNKILYEITRHQ